MASFVCPECSAFVTKGRLDPLGYPCCGFKTEDSKEKFVPDSSSNEYTIKFDHYVDYHLLPRCGGLGCTPGFPDCGTTTISC